MPIEYELKKGGTVVMAKAIGTLTLDCFMSMQKKMQVDDDLQNPHDTLLDARSVSKIDLKEEELDLIAKGLTSDSKTLGANKLAIVTHNELAFTLGKKYGTVKKGVNENVIVFYNISVAQQWLGLD